LEYIYFKPDVILSFYYGCLIALKPLRIRVGGSLQDQVVYEVGNLKSPCQPFQKMKGGLFGFSKGCLQMKRWDELNHFFNNTG
jgi:heparanase 1